MNEVTKKLVAAKFEKAKNACSTALKHSRTVTDLQVMPRKEFIDGWDNN